MFSIPRIADVARGNIAMFQESLAVRTCPGFPLRFAWAPSLPPPTKSPGTNLRRNPGQHRRSQTLSGKHSDACLSAHSKQSNGATQMGHVSGSGSDVASPRRSVRRALGSRRKDPREGSGECQSSNAKEFPIDLPDGNVLWTGRGATEPKQIESEEG